MRLIGMLDSPYVRRVAISLKAMNLPFSHESLSVFSAFDDFTAINPVVRAPTLVTDEGTVLMESNLILDYAGRLAAPKMHLVPCDIGAYTRSQRIVGLALTACEKTVQIVYERNLRPAQKWHQPWLDRVQTQLAAAYRLLETEIKAADPWLFGSRLLQADITSAVAWRFSREMVPDMVPMEGHPALSELSTRAEATKEFSSFPFR